MAGVVVDASVAVKWYLPEDRSAQARQLLASGKALLAPSLVILEIGHAMWAAARGGRTTAEAGRAAVENALCAFTEVTPDLELVRDASAFLNSLQHPIYDCLYLALARRSGATLVTADDQQFAAARKARVAAELL